MLDAEQYRVLRPRQTEARRIAIANRRMQRKKRKKIVDELAKFSVRAVHEQLRASRYRRLA
jgi:hypothetical protein